MVRKPKLGVGGAFGVAGSLGVLSGAAAATLTAAVDARTARGGGG
jgi:hypothetical protein